jgi:hypothetical protein
MVAALVVATASSTGAVTFNTGVEAVYDAFATGATVQTFEGIGGVTALPLTSYDDTTDGTSVAVPAAAQLSLNIAGLLFHSGGGSFNDPVGNPGTPAAVLALGNGIVNDARSATNVVGPLAINTEFLELDQFIEIVFIDALQDRVGFWLNPGLGPALLTAFDSGGTPLDSIIGDAGNFVGIQEAGIKFVSIIATSATGFTIDDLTYAPATSTTVPEPAALTLLAVGSLALLRLRRHRR